MAQMSQVGQRAHCRDPASTARKNRSVLAAKRMRKFGRQHASTGPRVVCPTRGATRRA